MPNNIVDDVIVYKMMLNDKFNDIWSNFTHMSIVLQTSQHPVMLVHFPWVISKNLFKLTTSTVGLLTKVVKLKINFHSSVDKELETYSANNIANNLLDNKAVNLTMSRTGSIRSVVSYEDNVTTGDCPMWNAFVAEYAVSPKEIRCIHQKYHWRPESDKVIFDGLVFKNKFLVCSTETGSSNIVPNVTFKLQVNLQVNQVEFVFVPIWKKEPNIV